MTTCCVCLVMYAPVKDFTLRIEDAMQLQVQ